VKRISFIVVVGACVALALVAGPSRASLYSPEESMAIPVNADGKAVTLPFDEFKRRLAVLRNAATPPNKSKGETTDSPDRKKFLDRIAKQSDGKKLSATEAAALATDLLRVGEGSKALDVLGPLSHDRKPNYFVFSGLAHIHANGGNWSDALKYHIEGRLDTEMPAEVKGLSKAQRDWWEKLDADYVPHLYRIRRDEAKTRGDLTTKEREKFDEVEDVLPLFPLPHEKEPRSPVRFVNDAGEYQPGTLATAEKAKLPPDALAIVQQLALWYPGETRLYWLLAELYAAEDDLDSAEAIFNECADSLAYGAHKVMMAHRTAVKSAVDARPKPEEPQAPISMRTVMFYFGGVAGVALLALVRTLRRSRRA